MTLFYEILRALCGQCSEGHIVTASTCNRLYETTLFHFAKLFMKATIDRRNSEHDGSQIVVLQLFRGSLTQCYFRLDILNETHIWSCIIFHSCIAEGNSVMKVGIWNLSHNQQPNHQFVQDDYLPQKSKLWCDLKAKGPVFNTSSACFVKQA